MKNFRTLLVVGGTLLLAAGCGGDDSGSSPGGNFYGPGAGGSGGSGGEQGGSSGKGAGGKAGMTSAGAGGVGASGASGGGGSAGSISQGGSAGASGQGGSAGATAGGSGGSEQGGSGGASAGSGGSPFGGKGGAAGIGAGGTLGTGGKAGSGTAGGGGSSASCGTIGTSDPACTACLQAPDKCCAQNQACTESQDCIDLLNCNSGCGGDTTCQSQCQTDHPSGLAVLSPLVDCLNSQCAEACSGVPPKGSVGSPCDSDAACAQGLSCLLPSGNDLTAGGPAGGYCSQGCSAWWDAAVNGGTDPDPCDPNASGWGTGKAFCLNFADTGQPTKALCVQSCTWGQPPFSSPDHLLGSPGDPTKCFGRDDVACTALTDANNQLSAAYCRPTCSSDSQCPNGRKCDLLAGECVPEASLPATLKKNGESCDVGVFCAGDSDCTVTGQTCVKAQGATTGVCFDPKAPRQCQGACMRRYDSAAPKVDQSKGFCVDYCVAGPGSQACGGADVGLCGFDFFSPESPQSTPQSPMYLPYGFSDIGGCTKVVSMNDDASCNWQLGFFATEVASVNTSLCLVAVDCSTTADCQYACGTDADCGGTATCSGGKCVDGGQPYTGGKTCVAVDALCGKKLCLDHTPTLPKPASCP